MAREANRYLHDLPHVCEVHARVRGAIRTASKAREYGLRRVTVAVPRATACQWTVVWMGSRGCTSGVLHSVAALESSFWSSMWSSVVTVY